MTSVTICFVIPQNQYKTFEQKSFKQKSSDNFTVVQSHGQHWSELVPARQQCIFVNVMLCDLDQSCAGILHLGITIKFFTFRQDPSASLGFPKHISVLQKERRLWDLFSLSLEHYNW